MSRIQNPGIDMTLVWRLAVVIAVCALTSASTCAVRADDTTVSNRSLSLGEPGVSPPASVTTVTAKTIEDDKITWVKDAAVYAPNVVMTEFSVRKLSNPRFRGVGTSLNSPGVTTYYDGVPQLSANSSSIELLDVEQIEFVRGPQGALFGRNNIGGLINITSRRPSLTAWGGDMVSTYGNYDLIDGRATASGPLIDNRLGLGVGLGWSSRDGYTKNDFTGHDLDSREAFFGKGQLLWEPNEHWDVHLLFTGERARDGDYALGDLAAIRANPHHVSRDFEGFTDRDLVAPTLITTYYGECADVSLTSGGVWWKTVDETDLDNTSAPILTVHNEEEDIQFTQELRVESAKDKPIQFSDGAELSWQAGLFFFTQADERKSKVISGASLRPIALDDIGGSIYGQATLALWEKLYLTAGVRWDYEHKQKSLPSDFLTAPAERFDEDFSGVSPQFSAMYRLWNDGVIYGAISRGFKAGGLDASPLTSFEKYDEETTWNYEAGLKSDWLDHRLIANVTVFYTHWDDLQLTVPFAFGPTLIYTANVGDAMSKGVEIEVNARPTENWDIFGSFGIDDAEFLAGSASGSGPLAGKKIPFTPDYTASAGMQYAFAAWKRVMIYLRGEVIMCGRFYYDEQNAGKQSAYKLANFRAGMRGKYWCVEGWVRNAFDEDYVPVALTAQGLAPSGFMGEAGAPVTFGVTAGLKF